MTTTATVMTITIRLPTAPPTAGPMMLGDINADSDCVVTRVEIVMLCVDMPVTGSVVLSVVDVGESIAALEDIGEPVIRGMTVGGGASVDDAPIQ